MLEADFLVVADGPSSHLRKILVPGAERSYAGYVAFRGTAQNMNSRRRRQKSLLSGSLSTMGQGRKFSHIIPGPEGALDIGQRLVNWVWYWNLAEGSAEFEDVFTDVDGNKHRWTLPTGGKMQAHVWQNQKHQATEHLPHQFAELVHKTTHPFVQVIADLPPPPARTPVGGYWEAKRCL